MAQSPEDVSRALRITFSYGPDGIRLVSRQAVTMQVPPSDDVADAAPVSGPAAELRTADDQTTFRRHLAGAIPHDSEVFDPDAERGMHRAPVAPDRGVFAVLVPDDARAQDLVLLSAPRDLPPSIATSLEPRLRAAPMETQELGRFPLREDGPRGNV